ncbi:hypothetical protein MUO93_11895 [Candidatus Bathyarchaeota archaeon]|jgi:hypothetical protein|nr:hypothetical protein [Candidatus Bathyarchaeota archaeon]
MISFTAHAKDKLDRELSKLAVTEETVAEILNKPDDILYDPQIDRYVAIDWSRKTAVVYEKSRDDALIITIIYSSTLRDMVERRRRSGRWI